jgi:hypothetical protein
VVVSDVALSAVRPFGILIPIEVNWSIRMKTAQRLHAVMRGQRPRGWFTVHRRKRIAKALRTFDGRRSGASYRDFAIALFGATRVADEPWKTSLLKAQVARSAALGDKLVSHGYRDLLRGRFK